MNKLELPESYTISRQLNETVVGKTIKSVVAAASPHKFTGYFGDPETYNDFLKGKTIDGAAGFGMFAELRAGDTRITVDDGAVLRYYNAGEKLPAKHQLHITFTDDSSLICTIQMYGGIGAFIDGTNENWFYLHSRDSISPLTDAFDYNYFKSLMTPKTGNISAKAFIATEQRIPGLGNGVAQDILWQAGIHPKRKMHTLPDGGFERLFNSVKTTLTQMAEQGGRDTERDLYGEKGGYQTYLSRNTLGLPCPRCGGEIKRLAYLGGNVYVCESCQPL